MSYLNKNSPTFSGDPKVPTASSGDSDTTAASTAFVQDAIDTNVPDYVRLRLAADQSVAHNTWTSVSNYDELNDLAGMHDLVTNPERITFKSVGLYLVHARAAWDNASSTGFRSVRLIDNDGNTWPGPAITAGGSNFAVPGFSFLHVADAIGDWIRMEVWQSSGANLTLQNGYQSTHFTATRIGDYS